ncbi:MAG: hypothetical protein PHY94_03590 [Candidatus Omnitrophica bacterium]|nr:hypothetical protein [Candidatus Omnitrophota bacterium]
MAVKFKVITLVLILLLVGFFTLDKPSQAQAEKSSETADSSKLEQIFESQKEILSQLALIKEQLDSIQLHTNKL